MKEKIEALIESGQHVFLDICPRLGRMWSEEGVITRLDANGWFQITFMGSTNGWHINQIQKITTD